jgi:copper chaperone
VETNVYDVPTISCEHCRSAIEKSVSAVPGVTEVSVDIDARQATVTGSSATAAVTAAIKEAGYEVASVEPQADLT